MEGKIGRYQILGELGRGGMSVVYLGRDPQLERQVAIKVLHAHLALDEQSRQRFGQEARAVARLRHPNIIEVYDFSQEKDQSFLVVEYVKGQTLKQFAEKHQVFFPEAAALICLSICQAVSHAHSLGIIHRDIKPENVMVSEAGELKLMDFGIAKILDGSKQLTLTGSIIGSPAHMAPEVLEGAGADFRSDIFSIGTILYWLATGKLPFSGTTPHQVIKNIVEGHYPHPLEANPGIGSLAEVITRTLEKNPADRYQTVSSLAEELEKFLTRGGIAEPGDCLKSLLIQPENTLEVLRRKAIASYFESGCTFLHQGKRAEALADFDRVLALEPGHKGVLEQLERLKKGKRRKKMLLFGATTLSFAVAAIAGWLFYLLRPPLPVEPPRQKRSELFDESSLLTPFPPEQIPIEEEKAKAPVTKNVQNVVSTSRKAKVTPTPAKPEAKYPVSIVVEPYFQRMYVDGKLVASAEESASGYGQFFKGELSEGEHRVVIEHPAAVEDAFIVKVPAAGEVRRKLRFLPAQVYLHLDVPVSVYVDGEYRGRADGKSEEPLVITMQEGPERRVHLRLVDDNQRFWERELKLRAGEKVRIETTASEFSSQGGGK